MVLARIEESADFGHIATLVKTAPFQIYLIISVMSLKIQNQNFKTSFAINMYTAKKYLKEHPIIFHR